MANSTLRALPLPLFLSFTILAATVGCSQAASPTATPVPRESMLSVEEHVDAAIRFEEAGRLEEAVAEWDHAIRLASQEAVFYSARGTVYGALGEYRKAIEDYDDAILLDPEDRDSYLVRGLTYAELGLYEQAVFDLGQAISLDPSDGYAYYLRGKVYAELGLYKQALQDFEEAIWFDPSDPGYQAGREMAYQALGAPGSAVGGQAVSFEEAARQTVAVGLELPDIAASLATSYTTFMTTDPETVTAEDLPGIIQNLEVLEQSLRGYGEGVQLIANTSSSVAEEMERTALSPEIAPGGRNLAAPLLVPEFSVSTQSVDGACALDIADFTDEAIDEIKPVQRHYRNAEKAFQSGDAASFQEEKRKGDRAYVNAARSIAKKGAEIVYTTGGGVFGGLAAGAAVAVVAGASAPFTIPGVVVVTVGGYVGGKVAGWLWSSGSSGGSAGGPLKRMSSSFCTIVTGGSQSGEPITVPATGETGTLTTFVEGHAPVILSGVTLEPGKITNVSVDPPPLAGVTPEVLAEAAVQANQSTEAATEGQLRAIGSFQIVDTSEPGIAFPFDEKPAAIGGAYIPPTCEPGVANLAEGIGSDDNYLSEGGVNIDDLPTELEWMDEIPELYESPGDVPPGGC